MAGHTGEFNKMITNARNSNENFQVEVNDNPFVSKKEKRTSAQLLQQSIIHGPATKKHFTTITPHGLPPDLIGDTDYTVERQNVLIEPRGHKNEAARLPAFKPFKTVSDEDNIHLLPGETGERARLNLLDTKAVTKKDIDDVHKAYLLQRQLNPELYKKQEAPTIEEAQARPPEPLRKKGFFNKIFGKKKEPEKPPPPPPPPPPKEEPKKEEPKIEEPKKEEPPPPPPPPKVPQKPRPLQKPPMRRKPSSSIYYRSSSSSSSSSSESSSEEERPRWGKGNMWGNMWPSSYPPQMPPAYPGFPGGYAPYFNQAYSAGFGPIQAAPGYNPCMEEIQLACCRRLMKEKGGGEGDQGQERKKKPKKQQQGLNFDFMPHSNLATEVTMTIEPDEPEPLQYAVENGIMPIICCYMPSSVAVQPSLIPEAPSSTHYSYYQSSYNKTASKAVTERTGSTNPHTSQTGSLVETVPMTSSEGREDKDSADEFEDLDVIQKEKEIEEGPEGPE